MSLMRNLVAGLSVASITKPKRAMISAALARSRDIAIDSILRPGRNRGELARGGDDLRGADVGFAEYDLARQIREVDKVGVDQAKVSESRAHQGAGCGNSESANSDNQNSLARRHVHASVLAARLQKVHGGDQKPSSGDKTRVLLLSPYLPRPPENQGNPAGLSTSTLKWAGCCGIVGPVPPPLWIRPQILRPKVDTSVAVCQSADQAVRVVAGQLVG